MRCKITSMVLLTVGILFSSYHVPQSAWKPLFSGKDLSGWDTYLGPSFDSLQNKMSGKPVGLNHDPNRVFTVVKEDGEKVIRISGEGFGAISTKETFANYHLKLMFKWGQLKWPPKKNQKRDSGVLYHSVGTYGADFGFWMRSQEFQVQEGDCGDYWGVAGGIEDIHASKDQQGEYVYDPKGPLLTFSATGKVGRHCKKYPDAEKPTGEWNTIELYCHGDTSVHVVNGVVNMILLHSRQSENGKEIPLTRGKLQLQSEGAEIFYKQIMIRPIAAIPASVLKSMR